MDSDTFTAGYSVYLYNDSLKHQRGAGFNVHRYFKAQIGDTIQVSDHIRPPMRFVLTDKGWEDITDKSQPLKLDDKIN